jgi:hypothetical protein
MKIVNLSAMIIFAIVGILAGIVALKDNRYELFALTVICLIIAYVAYKDYKNEENS